MINNKTVIAIIPARSGSKGLKNKNIKEFLGKPLISWSIGVGLKSKYIDEVMVTTDSSKISDISKNHGAKVPFLRPNNLSSDTATSMDVIFHALNYYQDELNQKYDYIILLEPTSPQRTVDDIDDAIEKLTNNPIATALVSTSKVESCHPAYMIKKLENDFFEGYENKDINIIRRQDFIDLNFIDGSIYISQIDTLFDKGSFYHNKTLCYDMPKWKSLEIDDLDDFVMIEALMNERLKNG